MVEAPYRWSPGIGDPTLMGWVTVLAYLAAAVLCAQCGRRDKDDTQRFWWVLAVLMAVLGINKQLDLQSWFTQVARDMALAQGWYANRRVYQLGFVAVAALVGLAGQFWLYRAFRSHGKEARWAVVGLVFLIVFIVARLTSFHHVDYLLRLELAGLRINWILELGGIGCIAAAAAMRLRHLNRPPQRPGRST
jgi:hypothetical protein